MSEPLYEYWLSCLENEQRDHPQEPQCGRWRVPARRTNTTGNVNSAPPKSLAIAVWPGADGKLVAQFVGPSFLFTRTETDGDAWHKFVLGTWLSCVAITDEAFKEFTRTRVWPDESEAVSRHNNAPPDDSFEAIEERIRDLAREAELIAAKGPATVKDECDQAADLANLLGQLEKKADDLRRSEKRPHEEAAKNVDRRWVPVRDTAAKGKATLKAKVITPFLTEQDRLRQADEFRALTLGEAEQHPAQRQKTVAGSRGRPVSLKTVKHVEISDRPALLAHFAEHAEVTAVLQSLAERSVRTGLTPPGVKVTEQKVAA